MPSSFHGADSRFTRFSLAVWCDHLNLPVFGGMFSGLVWVCITVFVVCIISLLDGEYGKGELIILGICFSALFAVADLYFDRPWRFFELPRDAMLLGWDDQEPVLAQNTADGKAALKRHLTRVTLVARVPYCHAITLQSHGGETIQREIVVMVSTLNAEQVVRWLRLPMNCVQTALEAALGAHLAAGGSIDESSAEGREALSRALVEQLRTVRQWVPEAQVWLRECTPQREPAYQGCA